MSKNDDHGHSLYIEQQNVSPVFGTPASQAEKRRGETTLTPSG
tara:strand:+ start:94 stop:222 length:129 start_codon:yes stop_codon:yes gene_type:complete